MLIDLHARTKVSAPNAPAPTKAIRAAKEAGLDGIAFVDRMHSTQARDLVALGTSEGFPVFIGVEIVATTGQFLCFAPEVEPFLFREEWRQLMPVGQSPTYQALFDLFDSIGGAVLASQPYFRGDGHRLGDNLVFCDGIHGVEVTTPNHTKIDMVLAVEAAVKIGLPTVGGSGLTEDLSEIGRAATLFTGEIGTQAELVEALRAGDFWAVELNRKGAKPRPRPAQAERRNDRRPPRSDSRSGRGGGDRSRKRRRGPDKRREA